MAFVVSDLRDYVENNKELILKDVVLGAKSISRATIQPGIKGSADLNFLATSPALQSGSNCGWNASGNATFTKRTIETAAIKVNMAFCKKTLIGKWTEYAVRFGANNEEMPFAQYIMDDVRKNVKASMEKLVWQAQKSGGGSDLFDGWLYIIDQASGTIKETIASGKSAYEAIKQVYMAIPQELLTEDDLYINVSPKVYRAFTQELTDKNLFNYSAGNGQQEILFPGTGVKVRMVEGLIDPTNHKDRKIVACLDRNLYYGCDMMSDSDDIALWFSQDNDEHRLKIDFNAGCQVAFPDQIVLGSMAADPVSPAAQAVALGNIATAAAKLAGAVNSNNQVETHPNS